MRLGLQRPQSGFHQRSRRTLGAAALLLHAGQRTGQGGLAPDAGFQHADHRRQQHALSMRGVRRGCQPVQKMDARGTRQKHGGGGYGHRGARQDRSGVAGGRLHALAGWAGGLRL